MADKKPTHPTVQILLGFVGLAVIHGLTHVLVPVSFGLAMAMAFIGAFGVPFTLSYRGLLPGAGRPTFMGLVAVYLGSVCVLTQSVFQLLPLGDDVELASVAEAPKHPGAGLLVIADKGEVRKDFTGEYNDRTGKYDALYQVHPIVPQGWTTGDPVPLWEGHCSTATTTDHELQSDSVAVVVSSPEYYPEAIADAEERLELHSSPTAPVISWVPPEVLADRARLAYLLIFSAYLVWLLGAALSFLLSSSKAKATGR